MHQHPPGFLVEPLTTTQRNSAPTVRVNEEGHPFSLSLSLIDMVYYAAVLLIYIIDRESILLLSLLSIHVYIAIAVFSAFMRSVDSMESNQPCWIGATKT
jgi:hypothetical protein